MKGFAKIFEAIVASIVLLASLTFFFTPNVQRSGWDRASLQILVEDALESAYLNGTLERYVKTDNTTQLNMLFSAMLPKTVDFSIEVSGIPGKTINIVCVDCNQANMDDLSAILDPRDFSYKMKNYVLLDAAGKIQIKGSSLRSRGLEFFQRQWMEQMFRLLLTGRREEIPALLRRWEEDFTARRVTVQQFMKTETLQESLPSYQEKVTAGKRNASALYELALRSSRPYQAGDQLSYYVTGTGPRVKVNESARLAASWDAGTPDENTAYYLAKLRDLSEKFRPFIDREGLRPVVEEDEAASPAQESLDLDA